MKKAEDYFESVSKDESADRDIRELARGLLVLTREMNERLSKIEAQHGLDVRSLTIGPSPPSYRG